MRTAETSNQREAQTRCVIADDHPALLKVLADNLRAHGIDVIATARDGEQAVAVVERTRPDVAVLDYDMPRLSGRDLLLAVKQASPTTAIVVYTAHLGDSLINEVFEAGAAGVVVKGSPLADVARAITSALDGREYLDGSLASSLRSQGDAPSAALTSRQREVLELLADGLPYDEIAKRMGVGPETARTHAQNAIARLGARTRTEAVAVALRRRLIA
jgi:DNA-binding NarL/FixJ family response regulator